MTIQTQSDIQIYVACLSAYNNGYLHGKWIDAVQSAEDIQEEVNAMLKESPEPGDEWAIHDYQGFESIQIKEWSDFETISSIAIALSESDDPSMFSAIYDHLGSGTSIDDVKEFIEENYRGTHKDLGSYAWEFYEETGMMDEIPKSLIYYVDWDSMGRDWELNGDIFSLDCNSGVHVFQNM